MIGFLLRRIWQTIPVILGVAFVIFVLFSVIPGTFASSLGDDGRNVVDAETRARLDRALGLSDPLPVRFGKYVARLATLDLGTSFRTRQPVGQVLVERLWPTLQLAGAAMLLAIAVGLPLGFVAAIRPGGLIDTVSMVGAVSGLSVPKFWLGLMLMYLFALKLGWFPSFGYGDGSLRYLVLPAIALGVSPLALLARTTRAAVLDISGADFIRTARAKGVRERWIVSRHLGRNALVIVLTTVGLQFGSILGQAVVVEKLFSWPGLGSLLVDSVSLRDIPVVQGAILAIVMFFLVVNTLVDVLCAAIDPRIQLT
jgi:peptide/nickel transport system permease protein